MSNHGIINYPDAQAVQKQLDELCLQLGEINK